MCEESTSFDLTPYDVASAIDAVNRLLVEQAKEVSHGDTITENFNVEYFNSGQIDDISQTLMSHTFECHNQTHPRSVQFFVNVWDSPETDIKNSNCGMCYAYEVPERP